MRPPRVEVASASAGLAGRGAGVFVEVAHEILSLHVLLLDDDSVELLVLVRPEQRLVVEEVAERGVEELLGELGIMHFPVLDAQREQAELPSHQEHVGHGEVATASRIPDDLKETYQCGQVAFL